MSRLGTVTSPALSKNIIAVGATYRTNGNDEHHNYVTSFSSRGPKKGRIKPDVCSVGQVASAGSLSQIDCGLSCENHEHVETFQGTYPYEELNGWMDGISMLWFSPPLATTIIIIDYHHHSILMLNHLK